MIDLEALNADRPPEWIDAADVDAQPAGGLIGYGDPGDWRTKIMTYTHLRRDGQFLTYRRWTDEDGDRFYREDVLRERPSFKAYQDDVARGEELAQRHGWG